MTTDTTRIDNQSVALWDQHARAEVSLLATIAPAPRQMMPHAESLGITSEHFTFDDLKALFIALHHAQEFTDEFDRAHCCRVALRFGRHWRDDETRPFICGSNWGPGPLAALFHRLPADLELVTQAAQKLLSADRQLREFAALHGRKQNAGRKRDAA